MVHLPYLGGLVLSLTAGASALSSVANTTSLHGFSNLTTTTSITTTTTYLYDAVTAVPVVLESKPAQSPDPVSISSQAGSSPAKSGVVVYAASQDTQLPKSQAAQSSPATGFQTVVVTQTIAGCSLGGSPAASQSTGSSVSGQAPYAIATVSMAASYAANTLLPAVHWSYPVDNIQNLAPIASSELYYSAGGVSDPFIQHLFASVSSNLSYESVVLDHSSYVANTSCSDDGIMVTFTSLEAFSFAADSWSAVSEFVLVTYTDGCHGSSDEQRTFWLIESLELSNGTLSIIAQVQEEIATENAIAGVDMIWGTYYPTANATNGTSSSSTSTVASAAGSTTSTSPSSSTSSSSSSNSTTNGSACGNAPSSTIDGLPAANCGAADFDTDIDNAIGYLEFNSSSEDASSIADFLPGADINSTELADAEDSSTVSRRNIYLNKRWGWNPFKAIASVASRIVKAVVTVATAPVRLVAAAVSAIPVVGDFIKKATELDPSVSGSKDFNFGPDANAVSPWGNAAQIYTKSKTSSSGTASADVTIYCVDCGVKGHVALAGQAKFNVLEGLHALTANINANLQAGVNIGLVANAQYSDTKSKELIRAPLPEVGVAVKGVFSAGVYLSVDAVSTVTVTAEGQALVGVVMTIPDFQATLNLFDQDGAGKSGVTGLTPTFQKRFEASGQVAASLRLALPIAINCGFEIPALNIKRAISLIEQPSLYGNMTVAASTSNTAAASDTCNNGLQYYANLQNDVNFDFLGVKTFNLNHYDSPALLQGCKQFSSSSSSSSSYASPSISANATASSTSTDASATDATSTSSSGGSASATSTDNASSNNSRSSTVTTMTAASSTTSEEADATTTNDAATTTDSGDNTSATTTEGATSTATSESTDAADAKRWTLDARVVPRQTNSTSSDDEIIADDTETTFDDDTSDTVDQTDGVVDDDTTDADNSEFQEDATQALDQSADETSDDGITYTTVIDVQATFQLIPGDDGNLYAGTYSNSSTSDTGLFASYSGAIFGDDEERILHYYPDELAVYNASRIRLSSGDVIPKTADAIFLQPIDYDSSDLTNPTTYFAVDTNENIYNLVLCDFSNSADSKVFIINGQSGLDSLEQNTNIKYTVTGAPVTSCYPLALVSGGNGTVTS